MQLTNQTILITGGTGSFGQKFSEIILKKYKPKALRIFSRGEFLQYQMAQKFSDPSDILRFFIGDVRDRLRLVRAMHDVDIVIHAAALKQIVTAEYNPIEAVATNITGTVNVIEAALDAGVKKAMLISTDKAVHPVNLYGATKLVAEKLFVQANSYAGREKTRFSCVRYGNVIGSRGSVIPLFCEQKKNGVLTVTHPDMTRFWIILEQGVAFVIKCLEKMRGGEIFIPKIPSIKINDLARAIAPRARIKVIGMRPGEKLHEFLLSPNEVRHTKEYTDYFVVYPMHHFWAKNIYTDGKNLPDTFEYTSATNPHQATIAEIKKMIRTYQSSLT